MEGSQASVPLAGLCRLPAKQHGPIVELETIRRILYLLLGMEEGQATSLLTTTPFRLLYTVEDDQVAMVH